MPDPLFNNHPHEPHDQQKYHFKDFLPLITIFSLIILFTLLRQVWYGWDLAEAMSDFMGSFFIVFGAFKILKWKDFAEAYSTYDIIAKKSKAYAYVYPLIELGLGVLYLMRLYPIATHVATVILMSISAFGVGRELMRGRHVTCACLGTVFKVPLTGVSLAENVLMALMALTMLLMHYFGIS